jgi:hypothetical protein
MKTNNKEIIILLWANMESSEKLPFLVMGKAKQPHCFKNIKSTPCIYSHNKTVLITCEIFHEFLVCLDR